MRKLAILFMVAVALSSQADFAQEPQPAPKEPSALTGTDSPEALRKHVPVLPAVRAKYWNIDPTVGYGMKDFGNGLYALSDNGWQSAFPVRSEEHTSELQSLTHLVVRLLLEKKRG